MPETNDEFLLCNNHRCHNCPGFNRIPGCPADERDASLACLMKVMAALEVFRKTLEDAFATASSQMKLDEYDLKTLRGFREKAMKGETK